MPDEPGADVALIAELVAGLESSDNAVAFIYDLLKLLAARYQLSDAWVLIDNATRGPQAFRLGRKPMTDAQLALVTGGRAQIVTVPHDGIPSPLGAAAWRLCSIALALHASRHDAAHDPLTRLVNRRGFDSALATAAAQSERYRWPFSLVAIDLNHFKSVNDLSGHLVGDELLRSFGECLQRSVRAGDTAARIGGDEFAVILGNTSKRDVGAFVERLRKLARDTPVPSEFAAGAASAPEEATDPAELFRLADSRLYENKPS